MKTAAHFDQLNIPLIDIQKIITIVFFLCSELLYILLFLCHIMVVSCTFLSMRLHNYSTYTVLCM